MRVTRLKSAALVLSAAALLSCGEPPLGPVPPPRASLIGSLLQATGLLQCTPLPTATATQTVGAAGGVMYVGPHTLSIPAGALGAPVTITGTAPSGNVNRIQFQPEGLVFQRSAALTMSYANCDPAYVASLLSKQIVYANSALNNILEDEASDDYPDAKIVSAWIDHFSNYAVAW